MRRNSLMNLTEERFHDEVMQSDLPVLIDFWAPLCGPCRTFGPMIEEMAERYRGRIKIGKMNIGDNFRISTSFGVKRIPTLILFKNGKAVDQINGAIPEGKLKELIEKSIE